eukprot:10881491-Ditylum_brightwellii.AAC.1
MGNSFGIMNTLLLLVLAIFSIHVQQTALCSLGGYLNNHNQSDITVATVDDKQSQDYASHKFIPLYQSNRSIPCIIDRGREPTWDPMNNYIQNQPTNWGLLYIKIKKAASSTLASVATRTA